MTLGEIISNYRGENQISMDEFAKRAGLSKGIYFHVGKE